MKYYKVLITSARAEISMLKIVAPKMCEDVSSRAMQIFGGMGVCQASSQMSNDHSFQVSKELKRIEEMKGFGINLDRLKKILRVRESHRG